MSLHELLGALRSYMANVTGRKSWSPIHDHLHYALIEGHDGEKRWHLVHPDALPHVEKLVDSGKATLHDSLGGGVRSGDGMKVVGVFRANRVPALVAEHPEYGRVVVKGGEQHTENPFDGVSSSSSWQDREDELNDSGSEASSFGTNAEFVCDSARHAGAPVVPLTTGSIGGIIDESNHAYDPDNKFFYHPDQYASFQPYISPLDEAEKNLDGLIEKKPGKMMTDEEKDWLARLDSRLSTTESITGAPDRHAANYIQVPTILSSGNIVGTRHGIDYEWEPNGGLLEGSTENIKETAESATDEIADDNDKDSEDGHDWLNEEAYVHSSNLGQLDVLNSLHRFGDPYGGTVGDEEVEMLRSPHDHDEDEPVVKAGHYIKRLGQQVRNVKPWYEE